MKSLMLAMSAGKAISVILHGTLPGFLGYLMADAAFENGTISKAAFLVSAVISGIVIDRWLDKSNARIREERAARSKRMEAKRLLENEIDQA